jgi:hypothetical protein
LSRIEAIIEVSVLVIIIMASVRTVIELFASAKRHERSAENFDKKIRTSLR